VFNVAVLDYHFVFIVISEFRSAFVFCKNKPFVFAEDKAL